MSPQDIIAQYFTEKSEENYSAFIALMKGLWSTDQEQYFELYGAFRETFPEYPELFYSHFRCVTQLSEEEFEGAVEIALRMAEAQDLNILNPEQAEQVLGRMAVSGLFSLGRLSFIIHAARVRELERI